MIIRQSASEIQLPDLGKQYTIIRHWTSKIQHEDTGQVKYNYYYYFKIQQQDTGPVEYNY